MSRTPDDALSSATPPRALQGLRVLVFGLGTFGGGEGAARFFALRGADVMVTDLRAAAELGDGVRRLEGIGIDRWRLGEHRSEDFLWADWVVVNPAVPPRSRHLEQARCAGKRLVSEVDLFLRWCPARRIAAVTGTIGKTTTVTLLTSILREGALAVHCGGNTGGSLLAALDTVTEGHIVLLELSSFQLARLARGTPRPPVAALTGIAPNHIEWHGSFAKYLEAKERILPRRGGAQGSAAVLPARSPYFARWRRLAGARVLPFDGDGLPPRGVGYVGGELARSVAGGVERLLGTRDAAAASPAFRANAACAAALALALGAPPHQIAAGLQTAPALPHRQEVVAIRDGVRFVNDSKATTPEAACAALATFGPRVVLLAGGAGKEGSYDLLAAAARRSAQAVVLFGAARRRLAEVFQRAGFPAGSLHREGDLAAAFLRARRLAAAGDVVLMAPGCPSYDEFRNYEERGDRFRELVGEGRAGPRRRAR